MYNSRKNIVCFVIMMILLISTSHSRVLSMGDSACYLKNGQWKAVSGSMIKEEQVPVTEVISVSSLPAGQQILHQFKILKKSTGLSCFLGAVPICSFIFLRICTVVFIDEISKNRTKTTILKYIHNTDGKK